MAVKVDKDAMTSCALEMGNQVVNIRESKSEADKLMADINKVYNTANASELLKKYKETSKKMDELYNALMKYVRFLINSQKIYEDTEKKIEDYLMNIKVTTAASAGLDAAMTAANLAEWK